MRYSVYDPDKENWTALLQNQSGGSSIAYFSGQRYQRGSSIGSFLGKLWRVIPRFLNSTVGQSLISGATDVAKDVAAGRSFKESAKEHGRQQVRNLVGVGKKRRKGPAASGCAGRRSTKRTHFITPM